MSPPTVYELTIPNSQRMTSTTISVSSIADDLQGRRCRPPNGRAPSYQVALSRELISPFPMSELPLVSTQATRAAQEDRQHDHGKQGQKLALPVLERLEPELRRADVGERVDGRTPLSSCCSLNRRAPLAAWSQNDAMKIAANARLSEFS